MEMKDELREPYSVFMDSHAMMRNHRKLRREICISRIVIFILLITCMTFCVLLYIQHFQGSKQNNENGIKKKEKESNHEFQYGSEVDEADVVTPLMASLSIKDQIKSKKANLTWEPYHNKMSDFCKNSCMSLTIPQEGIYRLSLQLTYCENKSNEQLLSLFHKIVRYPKFGGNLTILNVFETVYNKKSWCKSVFSEVSYVFSEEDEVMVESSNADLLSVNHDWSTKNIFTIQFISKIKEE